LHEALLFQQSDQWVIEDGMTDSDPNLRMAAVFACIITTLIP
jgi:hypothetical protein